MPDPDSVTAKPHGTQITSGDEYNAVLTALSSKYDGAVSSAFTLYNYAVRDDSQTAYTFPTDTEYTIAGLSSGMDSQAAFFAYANGKLTPLVITHTDETSYGTIT
ncbi:hypothetical protein, partial [Intestinimonas butyriciproducens]|uniref:hypothetical protein n=1 Tax=Intestinimonas butyriciproducens TaxID=1297617 RepID=UPI0019580B32